MSSKATASDESFGPGTDLVISLLVCLLVLMTLDSYSDNVLRIVASEQERVPEPVCLECPSCPEGEKILVLDESEGGPSFFENNEAVLTQQARDRLAAQVGRFRSALEAGKYRQLQIVGHASADTVRGGPQLRQRKNFVLSFERALAVADFLRQRRIPYECLAVTAWGRSQSEVLASWLQTGGSLLEWDNRGQYARRSAAESMESNRRVEVWGDKTAVGAAEHVCRLSLRSGQATGEGDGP